MALIVTAGDWVVPVAFPHNHTRMVFAIHSDMWIPRKDIPKHATPHTLEEQLVVEAFSKGASCRDIGKAIGRSQEWPRIRLVRSGVQTNLIGRARELFGIEVARLYTEEDMTLVEIASLYDRKQHFITDVLLDAGVRIRDFNERSQLIVKRAKARGYYATKPRAPHGAWVKVDAHGQEDDMGSDGQRGLNTSKQGPT